MSNDKNGEFTLEEIPSNPDEAIGEAIKCVLGQIDVNQKNSYLENIAQSNMRLNDFKNKPRSIPSGSPSFIVFLRQWNSFTPVLPSKYSTRGGGYFL